MKVSELISNLEKLNQDDRVYWWDGNRGEEVLTVEANDDDYGTFVTVSSKKVHKKVHKKVQTLVVARPFRLRPRLWRKSRSVNRRAL